MPTCFMQAGWGDHTASGAVIDRRPGIRSCRDRARTRSPSRTACRATRSSSSPRRSPAPHRSFPGPTYDLGVDYTSTTAANSVTVFQHTSTGWSYWTELYGAARDSRLDSRSRRRSPSIPAGVDRISFGVSIAANGTLRTTGYSLVRARRFDTDTHPDTHAHPHPDTRRRPPGRPRTSANGTCSPNQMPVRALHTTLLHDGRVLLVAGSGNDGNAFAAGTFTAKVWNPSDDTYLDIPVPYDMFCTGHVTLPDGKVLLSGGTEAFPEDDQGPNTFKGSKKSYYFDPDGQSVPPHERHGRGALVPDAHQARQRRPLGGRRPRRQGRGHRPDRDVRLSTMTWLPSNQVPQTWSFWGTYPHMYLLEDGMLFYSGGHTFGNGLPGTGASLYNWTTAQIWDVPGLRDKDLRDQAGSVLLPPAQDQKVMIAGGGNTDSNIPATNLVDIIDLSETAPHYEPGPDLPGPGKAYLNLLTLPDRTVLAADGAQHNRSDNVLTAAIYNPAANTWKSIDPDPVGRNYHSTSLVLPDGRVAVFGSNPADNSFETRVSIYSPPYLFRGTRPTITSAPDAATYGESFALGTTGDVVSASLLAPMSSTHQTDTNARLVDMPLTGSGGAADRAHARQPEPPAARSVHADGARRRRRSQHREMGVDLMSSMRTRRARPHDRRDRRARR